MWCLVVFQHDFHGQYPPQVKELTTKQDFSGKALSKQNSLAFIRLVPGADRVVRHICIRCILVFLLHSFLRRSFMVTDFCLCHSLMHTMTRKKITVVYALYYKLIVKPDRAK